ncbi:MAG: hypothetical protein KKD38_01965, partial [Candidatus Delongbacteria bacterium]|nr:hypothetical protein [Candidatus Delongbacteria bacterium]
MKQLKIYISLVMIITTFVFSQERIKKAVSNRSEQELRALERQLTYAVSAEKRGDLITSYNLFYLLIKKYETDLRVISGFIDI